MGKLTKRELISKIAQHTDYRKDVVEEIIDGFVDVAAEEIVNKGEFGMLDFFTITPKEWTKSYTINNNEEVPQRPRLIIRVSERLRNLWKFRIDSLNGEQGVITKDNWREVDVSLRNSKKQAKTKRGNRDSGNTDSRSESTNEQEVDPAEYNPFIDDEG